MVIGPGSVNFLFRMARQNTRFRLVDPPFEPQRPHHLRHHRVVAVVADAHLHLVLEIDAFDELEEAVHEVLARLLAIADDVDAGVLLLLEPKQGGVALGALQLCALRAPRRPELAGLGEPAGLGQAAGDGGLEQFTSSCRDFWTATK
jgi:hypothetical protein